MKLNRETAKLLFALEYLIGKECYNPHSYDGYTGDEGCSFRYPVYIYENEDSESLSKYRRQIGIFSSDSEIDPKMIRSMRYKFGANNLYIGEGLIKVIEFLEKRYGLDFNELEDSIDEEIDML